METKSTERGTLGVSHSAYNVKVLELAGRADEH